MRDGIKFQPIYHGICVKKKIGDGREKNRDGLNRQSDGFSFIGMKKCLIIREIVFI
jgi:hypothetical protein